MKCLTLIGKSWKKNVGPSTSVFDRKNPLGLKNSRTTVNLLQTQSNRKVIVNSNAVAYKTRLMISFHFNWICTCSIYLFLEKRHILYIICQAQPILLPSDALKNFLILRFLANHLVTNGMPWCQTFETFFSELRNILLRNFWNWKWFNLMSKRKICSNFSRLNFIQIFHRNKLFRTYGLYFCRLKKWMTHYLCGSCEAALWARAYDVRLRLRDEKTKTPFSNFIEAEIQKIL